MGGACCCPKAGARHVKTARELQHSHSTAASRGAAVGDGHLLLGITRAGIDGFLDRIGFPAAYQRGPELEWLAKEQEGGGGGGTATGHQLGYDLCSAIRTWLTSTGNAELSVCEVLRKEGSRHVRTANVFVSHIQRKDCAELWRNLEQACDTFGTHVNADTHFWVDYFVLRQCQHDFDPPSIRDAIASIGVTVAEIPRAPDQFLSRSFCVRVRTHRTSAHLCCPRWSTPRWSTPPPRVPVAPATDSRHTAHGTRHTAHGTWHMARGTRHAAQ